jgi:hypothetical protein
MKSSEIQRLRDAEPFEPFLIVLTDKSEVAVKSREDVYIPPVNMPYIWVSGEEGGPRCLRLSEVTGVRMIRRPRGKKAG